jgi:hypothetical protein
LTRKRFEAIVLKKVVKTHAKELCDNVYVDVVVKPLEQMDTFVPVEGITHLQLCQKHEPQSWKHLSTWE